MIKAVLINAHAVQIAACLFAATNALTCMHAAVLTNIYNALHDNGFLLFFEMTTVLPTLLWGLDAQCWNFEDEREFGLWVDRARWERLLEEVGFSKVSQHVHSLPITHQTNTSIA